ncbi:MAG: glycosyltransferase family 39 protein [Xanthomonadaceae bacterium]|nr:glycosyltransferase family 39 protein [Xanthomonadaceae bacterium]MDP2187027.1 glycosyltransferase family 39 protein [Xanthomonadales bacterium]MDZ4115446.1 glycosyltransferase family 39 protein [Xanthomonadaceae bacterium]MDZ4378490.1 glycosyltransferase family 39 protein [Xanthomonadaceae bacterium]
MTSLSAIDRRELLWFFVIALLVLAAGYGLREPWPADEPRFVLVARQMVESGDWWFPRRGHELYADKPPLYFWLLALAYQLIGSWRWSFLLPSLLAALGTLALTWDLGRRLYTPRIGLWAAGAVLICVQFVYQAKRAQIDPTVVFLITLSLWGLLRHLLLGPNRRAYLLGCFAAGLGVITKGVGFLPLLLIPVFVALRRLGFHGITAIARGQGRWWPGMVLFFVAIALWLLPMTTMALADGDPAHRQYLHELLFRQTATRYANAWGHQQPWWYFAGVIASSWLPFALALPWLLRPWKQAWQARDARVWLPLLWGIAVVLFFSLSAGKRDMYILPALPAFAWAAAPYLPALSERAGLRRLLFAFVLLLGTLLAVGGAAALWGEPHFELKIESERGLQPASDALWWLLLALGGGVLAAASVFRVRRALTGVLVGIGALWLGYGFGVHPILDPQNSASALMRSTRELAGPDTEIGLVLWKEQNLLQAVGPVTEFGFTRSPEQQFAAGLDWLRQHPAQRRLLVAEAALPACATVTQAAAVGDANRRRYWLLDANAVAACPTRP